MLSRRDLISAGVVGGLAPVAPAGAVAAPVAREEQQPTERESLRDIATHLDEIHNVLHAEYQTNSLSDGIVSKLRGDMEQFLRANTKFPDFIDVGVAVFIEIYDWHIKNRQPVTVIRTNDGHYAMPFMATTLLLRPEQTASYISWGYD